MLQITPDILRKFRARYKLSQSQAADHAGVHRVTWGNWETGKTATPNNLVLILKSVADKLRGIDNILQE
jgi:DNA-binding XRE family transcriptional regulator